MRCLRFKHFSFCVIVLLFWCGCSKDSDDPDPVHDFSYFTYRGEEHPTQNCLFKITNTVPAGYFLYFFNDQISYLAVTDSFYGTGDILQLKLDSSIFEENTLDNFNFDTFKTDTFTVKDATYGVYWSNGTVVSTLHVTDGEVISSKSGGGQYKFDYELPKGSHEIKGTFRSSITVVKQ